MTTWLTRAPPEQAPSTTDKITSAVRIPCPLRGACRLREVLRRAHVLNTGQLDDNRSVELCRRSQLGDVWRFVLDALRGSTEPDLLWGAIEAAGFRCVARRGV